MEKYFYIIEKLDMFKGIGDDLENVLKCLKAVTKSYRPDEILVSAGVKPNFVGIVLKGSVLITKEDMDGNRIIIAEISESGMYGEALACAGVKFSPVTVITPNGCEVLLIDVNHIITTCNLSCKMHSQLIKNMIYIIASKNLLLNRRIDILTQKTLREKLLMFFRSEMERNNSNMFKINFKREELADYLFANRSALSRELSYMREEGIIEYDKNMFKILKNI